jgi:Flp pilus assembly protein TadG
MENNSTRSSRALGRIHLAVKRWRDDSGNVAIVTALLMPIIVGTCGFAMDYAWAAYAKQKLDKAAEGAVIAAVSQSAATAGGGYSDTSWLKSYGLDMFSGNISQLSIGTVTPTMTVTPSGTNGVVATINYSANVPTFFSGIVGINFFPVSGTATAKASGITYINYYILVDISQSMGIGSTATDMSNLYNRVAAYNNGSEGESGCVFGCHVKQPGQTYTNEYLAHNVSPAINLRIDAAVSAVQNIIAAAKTTAGANNNIKIGLYTIQDDPTTGTELRTVASPSYNYTSLTTAAASIDLGNNISAGIGDSDFSGELSQFYSILPANGNGASAVSPLNYVFLITDGLVDTYGSGCTFAHCTGAFDPSQCTYLKYKATVGVVYTTYLPIYNQNNSANGYESNYSTLALPYVSQLQPNLSSCATSSKFFFEATDGPSITTGMQALFGQSQQSAILTQ